MLITFSQFPIVLIPAKISTRQISTAAEAASRAMVRNEILIILYKKKIKMFILSITRRYSLIYYSILVLVSIELQALEDTSEISWDILDTNCKSLPNLVVSQNRIYKKSCRLSIGQSYRLKCDSLGSGWKSNYLVIENSVYCEGTKSNIALNITITGKFQSFELLTGVTYNDDLYSNQPVQI